MDHVRKISEYLDILVRSDHFNLLTVVGPAGWAKTETIRAVLQAKGIEYATLGSYSTPLGLYNRLSEDPEQLLVIDDTAGLLSDSKALAVLNAATWPGANGCRVLTWESTSPRVATPEVEFRGKIVVLTNATPASPPARALVSRGLHYILDFDEDTVRAMLEEASTSVEHFPDQVLSGKVAAFILKSAKVCDPQKLNLRTLKNAYEIATHAPDTWPDLVRGVLPKAPDDDIIKALDKSGKKAKEQYQEYRALTGKSERTFFSIRVKLGLARAQVNRKGNVIDFPH